MIKHLATQLCTVIYVFLSLTVYAEIFSFIIESKLLILILDDANA